ncbi:MAG TPA: TIR domain-containing protein [Candidatus Sulfotelmatobacter sp.]|jgi:hypothetical protein|nr:TIR domain-containing protein [Candidatus Sulfotelmatobacter sp.]
MPRKVFFSFHYERDIWRTNVVRNSGVVEGSAAAGFYDASLWEDAKKKGESDVKKLIDAGLVGTSLTVVLIGAETSQRKFVNYEIEQSIARGNGLLGIYISGIKDSNGNTDVQGAAPWKLIEAGAPCNTWDKNQFGTWVEAAYKKTHPND